MYTGAALSFGLIRACRRRLVLYCSVLSDAGGENNWSSAIFERSLLCSLAAILENGCHGRHGTNPECLRSLKWPLWYIVWVCQVSYFNHKVHDFSVICWTIAFSTQRPDPQQEHDSTPRRLVSVSTGDPCVATRFTNDKRGGLYRLYYA